MYRISCIALGILLAFPAFAQRGGGSRGGGGMSRGGGGMSRGGGGFSHAGAGFTRGGGSYGHTGAIGSFHGGSPGYRTGGGGIYRGGFVGGISRYRPGWGFGYGYYPGFYGFGFGLGLGYGYYGGYYGGFWDPYYYSGYYGYGAPYAGYAGYGYAPAYSAPSSPVVIVNDSQPAYRGESYPRDSSYDAAPPQPREYTPTIYSIAFSDHRIVQVLAYWVKDDMLHYVTREHEMREVPLAEVDRRFSEQINRDKHVEFRLPE